MANARLLRARAVVAAHQGRTRLLVHLDAVNRVVHVLIASLLRRLRDAGAVALRDQPTLPVQRAAACARGGGAATARWRRDCVPGAAGAAGTRCCCSAPS